MPKDELGHFAIPDEMLEILASQEYQELVEALESQPEPEPERVFSANWTPLVTYNGTKTSSGKVPVHTVEIRQWHTGGIELKCTCQGFRIQKKGSCKHTDRAMEEFKLT